MIKADIVSRLAERMGITKVKAEMAFDSFLDALRQAMKRGERIELRGLRCFCSQAQKERNRQKPPHRGRSSDSSW